MCRRPESNRHEVTLTAPSRLRVYQFHHFGKKMKSLFKILTNYLSEQGKILPRRVTGLTSKQQKKVTKLIKTARIAALLPFVIGKS